jgi:hypothetical protein
LFGFVEVCLQVGIHVLLDRNLLFVNGNTSISISSAQWVSIFLAPVLLKCENKFRTRLEQQNAIHEHIPRFAPAEIHSMDELDLPAPFWIKPVRPFRAYLAFETGDQETFL